MNEVTSPGERGRESIGGAAPDRLTAPGRIVVLELDADAAGLEGRDERLAFWINAYNAVVEAGIVRLRLRRSVWEVPNFFARVSCRLGDCLLNADEIEHGVLRGNRPSPLGGVPPFAPGDPRGSLAIVPMDPRMHFAINCGARSCPAVRRFGARELDAQLDAATRSYLEREVTVENDVLTASEIFRWFRGDFEEFPGGLKAFLLRYLPDGLARRALVGRGLALIEYRPYDWSLRHPAR